MRFSIAFSWHRRFVLWLKYRSCLNLNVQLTIGQWFNSCAGLAPNWHQNFIWTNYESVQNISATRCQECDIFSSAKHARPLTAIHFHGHGRNVKYTTSSPLQDGQRIHLEETEELCSPSGYMSLLNTTRVQGLTLKFVRTRQDYSGSTKLKVWYGFQGMEIITAIVQDRVNISLLDTPLRRILCRP